METLQRQIWVDAKGGLWEQMSYGMHPLNDDLERIPQAKAIRMGVHLAKFPSVEQVSMLYGPMREFRAETDMIHFLMRRVARLEQALKQNGIDF